ncbi:acetyltransferase (GNAT) family protein [Kribbella voronezhensis]|uniref:Acetyltransferase (GNAT) family protein n=1 Tax=Kribbella voronezhensis TaxID=2512212 RepID=A0A4R7T7B7_9ACTN|nr:GNAT family N-acetyltransferase [Kribbella voronezhensis]TDU87774.1 acetyltransferase (GNAT) family protein [Kribbella voronezhensis]
MVIRPAELGDLEAAVALHDELVPYLVYTEADLRHRLTAPKRPGSGSFVAVSAGRLVGWASCGLIAGSEPLDGEHRLMVHPDYCGQGLGTELLDAVHAELRAGGATRSRIFADPASTAWAARWGYAQTRQVHYAEIEPAAAPPLPAVPDGVSVVPLSEVDPRLVYEADMVAQRTKPGDAKITTRPYDDWLGAVWNTRSTLKELSFAALDGERVIGFTRSSGDEEKIWSRMTATMPEYRGQGLAKLVKCAALHRAADAGVRGAYTANYDGNAPMLAVNEWLGYRRIATHSVLVCPL